MTLVVALVLVIFPFHPTSHYTFWIITLFLLSCLLQTSQPSSRPSWAVSSVSFPRRWRTVPVRLWMQLWRFTTVWVWICCPLQPSPTMSSISGTSPSVCKVRHEHTTLYAHIQIISSDTQGSAKNNKYKRGKDKPLSVTGDCITKDAF